MWNCIIRPRSLAVGCRLLHLPPQVDFVIGLANHCLKRRFVIRSRQALMCTEALRYEGNPGLGHRNFC